MIIAMVLQQMAMVISKDLETTWNRLYYLLVLLARFPMKNFGKDCFLAEFFVGIKLCRYYAV